MVVHNPTFFIYIFIMQCLCFSSIFSVSLEFYDFADCFCTLKVVDESYPKPGLSVNVFAEHFGALPHVASLGDIVQLSHVMVFLHKCAKDIRVCILF